MRRNWGVARSMPSNADHLRLECASACSNALSSAPASLRFAKMRVTYILIVLVTIVFLAGCTDTSYQDYPDHWPAIDQADKNGCIPIAGVYHAVSLTDEIACKQVNYRNWIYSLPKVHESCLFLPDAMLSWDGHYPATAADTDHILIEQRPDRIIVNYVDQSKKRLRLSLQHNEDYSCDGNAISLIPEDKDTVVSGDSVQGTAHKAKTIYRGQDGSLIVEVRDSHLRTLLLPPYLVNTLTRVWARWPLISDAVSDNLMQFKAPFIKPATEAAERGDMGAAYRLLEDYLGSQDNELKALSLQLLKDYPQIKPAALNTFSIQSLKETLLDHGDKAKAIEQARLEMYRSIATEQEYQQARENFEMVFP